jgi:hypothetical protein
VHLRPCCLTLSWPAWAGWISWAHLKASTSMRARWVSVLWCFGKSSSFWLDWCSYSNYENADKQWKFLGVVKNRRYCLLWKRWTFLLYVLLHTTLQIFSTISGISRAAVSVTILVGFHLMRISCAVVGLPFTLYWLQQSCNRPVRL